jgi:ABC-2 type transport system ATP-binding protein
VRDPSSGSNLGRGLCVFAQRVAQPGLLVDHVEEDCARGRQELSDLRRGDRVHDLPVAPLLVDEARTAQHRKLMGERAGLAADVGEQLVHRVRAFAQELEHADAHGVPERSEELRLRFVQRSWHVQTLALAHTCKCTALRSRPELTGPVVRAPPHADRVCLDDGMTGTPAIEASGLTKSFGETRAVDGVDLSVPRGAVYGVLGPNGAGKTTTIRMLATLLRPDSGTARVLGRDIVREAQAVRGLVALTGQLASVDDELTGRENLILLGRLLGFRTTMAKARADELLYAFELDEAAGRLVKQYSGGMRRRLDIAASIVVTPELLFLDEPTTGLDPRSRNDVWDIVRALVADGTTVLLCTQYLDEADQLAERIAVIDHGRAIAEGTPSQLKASVGGGALHVRLLDPGQRAEARLMLERSLGSDVHLATDPAALSAAVAEPERAAAVVGELTRAGVELASFSLAQPSLDEVFLALTGHAAVEAEEDAA